MAFYSGPGVHYLQSAFHNTPPQPGESAQVLGRVRGEDGLDWLFVRFTGHWFSGDFPVQYYLPLSAAPEHADAPLMTFSGEANALAAESVRIYADPEGTNYDGYLTPDAAGVTVLDTQGDMAYIEAVNPYGILRRGYVRLEDLASQPGVASLPAAPQGTAVLARSQALPLTHPLQDSQAEALLLSGGSLVLRYGTIPEDAPWGEALAVISPEGELVANAVYRTHNGMEETTVEFLLSSPLGFRVCRFAGDALTPVWETHYAPDGELMRTDVRRYSEGAPRPRMGTAGFTVSLGRAVHAQETGSSTIPLRIGSATGAVAQLNVDMNATLVSAEECGGVLLLFIADSQGLRCLTFDRDAALVSDVPIPAVFTTFRVQAAATADGSVALLLSDDTGAHQSWLLSQSGTPTPGQTLHFPANRSVDLLAADGENLLIALSGVDTQLLLTDGQAQQLAAATPGALLHCHTDGRTATLLLAQDGGVRLETWNIAPP